MARDAKRQQKKREKKAAKRKAKASATRASSPSRGILRASAAAHAPFRDCLVPRELFEIGIGVVILSRSLPSGEVAVASFLLDVYCLGVKDAHYQVLPPFDYGNYIAGLSEQEEFAETEPACLRKLVEGAEAFARECGLRPHRDYATTAPLFGDIDPSACPEHYSYGVEGKPLYINGPNDSPTRIRQVLEQLERRLGADGYRYEDPFGDDGFDDTDDEPQTFANYAVTNTPILDPAYSRLPESVQDRADELYAGVFDDPAAHVDELEQLIRQYPDVAQFYNYLHAAYDAIGDEKNARRMRTEMLERFPGYLFGLVAQAAEHLRRGETDEVWRLFGGHTDLDQLYPERRLFHISEVLGFGTVMGWYFHLIGDRDRAEEYYLVLEDLAPNDERTRMLEGMLTQKTLMDAMERMKRLLTKS